MKIGIFSDLHDQTSKLEKIKNIFEASDVEVSLFCGDLTSSFNFLKLSQLKWKIPIKAVLGNNEGDQLGIKRKFEKYKINIEYPKHELVWDLEIDKRKIAIFHGHIKTITEALIKCQKYDLVCTGHTHVSHISKVSNTCWINPGSIIEFSEESKVIKSSVAIYDTKTKRGEILYLDN